MSKIIEFFKDHRFTVISWGATGLIVVMLLTSTLWWTQLGSASPVTRPQSTVAPNENQPSVNLPSPSGNAAVLPGIARELELKTNIAPQSSYKVSNYKVVRGDSLFAIAKQFNLKPESLLYSNEDTLYDNPQNLSPGMTLVIPPVDGLLYTWKADDTVESVAEQFKANPDDIINWPGNGIDLTDPQIKPGTNIMVPGGQRELISWLEFVPTTNRSSGSATSELGGSGCNGGPIGMPGIWPTNGPHTISGNDYSPKHLGIDITATLSTAVLASGDGVVVFAGFSGYGYGNVVQIDHGNGFSTIYAHLSQINVSHCEAVYGGEVIGMAGSTGNSTGVHLHFEVREGGVNLNPWSIVQ